MGLKEKVLSRKSQISKKLRLVRDLNKPIADLDRLWRLLGEAEAILYEMMDIYDDLVDEQDIEANAKAILDDKIKTNDEYASKISEVASILMDRDMPEPAQGNTRQRSNISNEHQFKQVSDMKPFMLSSDAEPFEMRIWLEKFQAYYEASHAEVLTLTGRKAIFKNFLTADLCVVVEEDIKKATSIDACHLILERHFLDIKPLFSRRLALFQIKKDKRPFKDFVADLRRRAREAELSSITPGQLLTFLAIAGCKEEKIIFTKLRELKDPSVSDLLEKAAQFEGVMKDVALPSPVFEPISAEAILAAVAVSCGGCGYPHPRERCPFRDRPCYSCGKVGHLKSLCRQRSSSGGSGSRNPTNRGRPRERTRRGSPAVQYDGETSRSPSITRLNVIRTNNSIGTRSRSHSSSGMDYVEITTLDKQIFTALPDSGAASTVLPLEVCPKGTVLEPSHTVLSAANGTHLISWIL